MRKIFYLLIVFVLILFVCSAGCVASDYETVAPTPTPTPTTVRQVTFEEKLTSEISSATQMGNVKTEKVTLSGNKKLVVYLRQDTVFSKEGLRKWFAYTTYDAMGVIVKYPDRIDTIVINGRVKMQDTKGNQFYDTVYSATTTMKEARTVNWGNMYNYKDPVAALDYNFDVRWDGSIRP